MIDPNEAPDGFTAMEPTGYGECSGCVFRIDGGGCSRTYGQAVSCDAIGRMDGQDVIFIKREEAKPIGESIESLFADVDAALKSARLPSSPDWVIRPIGAAAMDVAIPALHRLRDEFAKEAMAGSQGRAMTETQMTQAACIAYWQADAMLAAKFNTMTWGQK